MRYPHLAPLLTMTLICLGATASLAQSTTSAPTPPVRAERAWARPTSAHAKVGAAYMTLTETAGADALTGVATPIAAAASLHETTHENGVTRMRSVASLPLDPNRPVTLKPGGLHVMLTGLRQPLKTGTSFPLTLSFAKAGPVTITVTVGTGPVEAPAGAGGATADESMPGMKMDQPKTDGANDE